MSRKVGFVTSFAATVVVVVPCAWHLLDAEVAREGKKLRPMQQTFVAEDGTRVTLDVDRNLIETGQTVTAKLRAFSDRPHVIAVDMRVLHSSNYAGERVEQPWVAIDHEKLLLTALPKGGPAVLSNVKLGDKPDKLNLTDSFKI